MLGRMTWTAPQITRQSTPSVAGERQMLQAWLDAKLPDMLERLVRAELSRAIGGAV